MSRRKTEKPPVREPPEVPEPVGASSATGYDPEKVGREALPVSGYDIVRPTEASILMCARLVHVAIEALNTTHNEYMIPWDANKDSIIAGVKRTLANPLETAEKNHNAWHEYKRAEGWVYGPSKDEKAKTHPCMVPYAALSPYHQSKDAIFQAIVREFFGLKRLMIDGSPATDEQIEEVRRMASAGEPLINVDRGDGPERVMPPDSETDGLGVGLTEDDE